MDIYIDIETIPTQRTDLKELIAADISPPANITKEETMAKWNNEKKPHAVDEAWRKTALNGTFGELLAIGWAIDDDQPSCVIRTIDEPEKNVLEDFFNQLAPAMEFVNRGGIKERRNPTWIGHFISGFDMRFIWQRAVINGIKPPFDIPYNAKPWDKNIYDTKTQWTGHSTYGQGGSLDKVCQAMGYAGKGDLDGGKVWDAVLQDRYSDISMYCMDDVEKARALHRRMTFKVTA